MLGDCLVWGTKPGPGGSAEGGPTWRALGGLRPSAADEGELDAVEIDAWSSRKISGLLVFSKNQMLRESSKWFFSLLVHDMLPLTLLKKLSASRLSTTPFPRLLRASGGDCCFKRAKEFPMWFDALGQSLAADCSGARDNGLCSSWAGTGKDRGFGHVN